MGKQKGGQQPQYGPGQLFGLPGLTGWTEQLENNDQITIPISGSVVTPANGIIPFKQTDVVFGWEVEHTFTPGLALGGGTVATSPWFPYNFMGESQLKIQNMYPNWHPLSGIDAAIWQMIRPMREANLHTRHNLGANPAQLFANAALPQANLDTTASMTSGTTAPNFTIEIPASIFFDSYYDLTKDGTILSRPLQNVYVSPQYMAGSARQIQPQLSYNPILAANLDQGPFFITGAGPAVTTPTVKLGFRRHGVYAANNPAMLPLVYNWQYMKEARQVNLSGASKMDIALPTYGQILSVFVRLFDPAAANGGAPINVGTAVNICRLEFGSGLLRYQDTPRSAQRRYLQQHGQLPPVGTLVWDLGTDNHGNVTNALAQNTLTTAGVQVHLEFGSALSSSAYAVVGVEALTYVE